MWEEHPDEFFHGWIKEQYTRKMRFPLLWMVTAYRLKRAADQLLAISELARRKAIERIWSEHNAKKRGLKPPEPLSDEDETNLHIDIDQISTYFMLTGLAIENVAKGILVANDPGLVSDEGDFTLGTHNLVHCVEQCGIELSAREKEVLEALKEYVLWAGRYPGRIKAFLPKRMSDGSFQDSPGIDHHDSALIDSLFIRVYDLLGEIMKAGRITAREDDDNDR